MQTITTKLQNGFKRFSFRALIPGFSAGLVIGILVISFNISFAAVLFPGDLSEFVARGIGLMLLGAMFYGIIGSLFSGLSSTSSIPQDGPVAVFSVVAVSITASLENSVSSEVHFLTVFAALILTTLTTGVFFYLIGHFNLGNLVRYIPYPVVGGFLAGAGWLLVTGALGVLVDAPIGLDLLQPANLIRWLPGLIFAITFLTVINRFSQLWVMPAFLTGSTILFYILYLVFAGDLASAEAQGWLLGPFPEGELWQPFILQALPRADWGLVIEHISDIGTIILVSAITFLLNLSAISVGINQETDMNRELKTTGIANMLGSLGGFSVGYTAFSTTILSHRLAGGSRLVAMIVAILSGITVFFGTSFLGFFPRMIAGGLLLFLGLSFMKDYLIDAYGKIPKLEYFLMWVIVIVVASIGFLEGVFIGTLIAVVLFSVNYGRTRTVRLTTTAASYQSQMQRPILYQQLLKKHGDKLLIFSLQGHIFFGNASSLFDTTKHAFEESIPEFLLLDFRLVTGIDSSAMLSLSKIMQIAGAYQVRLIFTSLSAILEKRLCAEVLVENSGENEGDSWYIFPDLDDGLAWGEAQIIQRFEATGLAIKSTSILNLWAELLPTINFAPPIEDFHPGHSSRRGRRTKDDPRRARLKPYLKPREFAVGDILVEEAERYGGLIFIESGQVMVQVLDPGGNLLNMKIVDDGTIVGDTGFYAQMNTRLSVIATEPTHVFMLSAGKITQMEADDSELAIALHRLVAGQLTERNLYLDDMIKALQF
jgi:sulfate permease, SulP family